MRRGAERRVLALAACTVLVLGVAHVARETAAWSLVVLGDSITTGAGCDGCVAFPDLYRRATSVEMHRKLAEDDFGEDGSTSEDLIESLDDGAVADAVRRSDIVTLAIGANDFAPMLPSLVAGQCGGSDGLACFDPALDQLHTNLDAILHRVQELRGGRPTAVQVAGYWNVFVDGAVATAYGPAFQQGSVALTRKVNTVISAVAAARQATYVDLFTAFKGADGAKDPTELLAPDGDHPNQAGHLEIAAALVRSGLAPLPVAPRRTH